MEVLTRAARGRRDNISTFSPQFIPPILYTPTDHDTRIINMEVLQGYSISILHV